ncbi:hypothetical protein [Streptomyces sp. NPDC008240]|uniref:hypothetical protein n=2 Tax=unclassified Streptomyces TaxID=2593676 RepID=UPI0036EC399A
MTVRHVEHRAPSLRLALPLALVGPAFFLVLYLLSVGWAVPSGRRAAVVGLAATAAAWLGSSEWLTSRPSARRAGPDMSAALFAAVLPCAVLTALSVALLRSGDSAGVWAVIPVVALAQAGVLLHAVRHIQDAESDSPVQDAASGSPAKDAASGSPVMDAESGGPVQADGHSAAVPDGTPRGEPSPAAQAAADPPGGNPSGSPGKEADVSTETADQDPAAAGTATGTGPDDQAGDVDPDAAPTPGAESTGPSDTPDPVDTADTPDPVDTADTPDPVDTADTPDPVDAAEEQGGDEDTGPASRKPRAPEVGIDAELWRNLADALSEPADHRREQGGVALTARTDDGLWTIVGVVLPQQTWASSVRCEFSVLEVERVRDALDSLGPDHHDVVNITWLHTHPGLSVFLSATDHATSASWRALDPEFRPVVVDVTKDGLDDQIGVFDERGKALRIGLVDGVLPTETAEAVRDAVLDRYRRSGSPLPLVLVGAEPCAA